MHNVINDVIAVACVVVGDWLKPLKQFQDLHIFRHANKYDNKPETILKQILKRFRINNNSPLIQPDNRTLLHELT